MYRSQFLWESWFSNFDFVTWIQNFKYWKKKQKLMDMYPWIFLQVRTYILRLSFVQKKHQDIWKYFGPPLNIILMGSSLWILEGDVLIQFSRQEKYWLGVRNFNFFLDPFIFFKLIEGNPTLTFSRHYMVRGYLKDIFLLLESFLLCFWKLQSISWRFFLTRRTFLSSTKSSQKVRNFWWLF